MQCALTSGHLATDKNAWSKSGAKSYRICNFSSLPAEMPPVLPRWHVTLIPCWLIVPWQPWVATRPIQNACCCGARLGRDKITVWFRLHTAQKVGSVGRENILFWTKIFISPVSNLSGKMVQNWEVWHHTHTEHTWQHAILSLHGTLLFTNFHYISGCDIHAELYHF